MNINKINSLNSINFSYKKQTNNNLQKNISIPQYSQIKSLTHFYKPAFKGDTNFEQGQQQNIINSKEKEINYTDRTTPAEQELIKKFFNKDKSIKIKAIVGSNGTTYIISDTQTKLVIKAQHKAIDGKPKGMVIRTDSKDFVNEAEKLKQLPENIHTTQMLAEINLDKSSDERKLIALSFINGTKLSEAGNNFLNKENLSAFYNDLLELDKKELFHRDLNAFNVMANNNRLYIIDYGSAKTFDEMNSLSLRAKKLFEKKVSEEQSDKEKTLLQKLATEALKDEKTRKKEEENRRKLNDEFMKNIKYRRYEELALSNLENFETLGLLPYLKIHSDNSEKNGKNKPNSTDKLFLEHLKLKGNYYKKRIQYYSKNKGLTDKQLENEKIIAKQLSLINPDTETLPKIVEDIANVELLRIKMLNSQKAARLYIANDTKNYKMALYWNMDLGITSKFAMDKISDLQKEYVGNDDMLKYLQLNQDFATFYNKEIFPEVYSAASTEACQAITNTTSTDMTSIKATMNDGCWLDSSKRAPSNYIPDTPHKFNCFQF